jgi:hypothetical protein
MKPKRLISLISFSGLMLLSGFNSFHAKDNKEFPGDIPFRLNWTAFLNNQEKITKLSSIANSISYIRLETTDSVKIGNVRKVIITKQNLFILDQTFSIFVFSLDGKYRNKISHVGRGPGEYPSLSGFTVDEKNNIVAVLSNRKILFYNFSGQFVKDTEVEGQPVSVEWIGDNRYLVMMHVAVINEDDPAPCSSVVIDSDGKTIARHPYYVKEKRSKTARIAWVSRISKISEGVLVNELFNDTTYIVRTAAKRIPYIINDFGNFRPPREYLEGPDYNPRQDTKYILRPDLYPFSNYAYISFGYKGQSYFGIWDFKNKAALSIPYSDSEKGLKDDLDSGLPYINPLQSGDQLFDILQPVKLLSDKTIQSRPGSQLEAIMKDLKVDDNPIIRILNMKSIIKANK